MTPWNVSAIDGMFSFEDGYHRADWEEIGRWVESNVPSQDARRAWEEIALSWVRKLCDDLGGDYSVYESARTILLSDQPEERMCELVQYADRATSMIEEQLGKAARREFLGKVVILIFSDPDDYYQYIAFHSPDGEQPSSGGLCLNTGYVHIAIQWQDEFDAANVVIHELSHECVAHLQLPMWLNEGLAVSLEKALAPAPRVPGQSEQDALFMTAIDWRPPIMWDELAERHFAFWNEDNIQEFWAGTSFYLPGESSELSYSLAEVLLKLITDQSTADGFQGFVMAARQEDAGSAAAWNVLGVELGEVAATFLGQGEWRPKKQEMIGCWERAGWKSDQGGAA